MANFTAKSGKKLLARIGVLGVAGLSLSGCYTGLDGGYYDVGYASNSYCDPYAAYDSYYDCDTGYGFNNIGYGGGWYDNYFYPGYGVYLFDNSGRRHDMNDGHRRYWSGRRHDWQKGRGGNHGRGNGWSGNDDRGNGNWNGVGNGNWRDRDNDRNDGDRNWGGGRNGRDNDGDGNGRRGNWRGNGNNGSAGAVTAPPRADNPGRGNGRGGNTGGRNWGNGNSGNGNAGAPRSGGNRSYTPPSAPSVQQSAPAQRAAPPPRAAPVPRSDGGGNGRVNHPRNGNADKVREN